MFVARQRSSIAENGMKITDKQTDNKKKLCEKFNAIRNSIMNKANEEKYIICLKKAMRTHIYF